MDTPTTSPAEASPAPSAVFTESNSPAPEWVKSAGLESAHDAGTTKQAEKSGAPVTPAAPVTPTAPVTPVAPVAPTAPTPASADPVAIARAVAEGIRAGNAPAPAGPTDDQIAQQLGIITVTPQLYKSILGVDGTPEQITGLNNFGQDIAKQAVTIASVLMQREIKALQDSLSPYTTAVRQQEAGRVEKEFYASHSDLVGYEAAVRQQYQLALASGQTFSSIAEASKFVADQTRSTLKALGITPGASAPNGTAPTRPTAPQSRPMTPTSLGGKGSGSGQPTSPKTTNEQVWG